MKFQLLIMCQALKKLYTQGFSSIERLEFLTYILSKYLDRRNVFTKYQ